jgi:menaquinone-9 beta-reductase
MRRTDTLILGGGPAGSAAAIMLARSGARPMLLERQRETGDALCGGFLSWHSLAALERLGISGLQGAKVGHLRLFGPSGQAAARLPRPALGVSRHQLDTALLAEAERLGAAVERGVTVREVGPTVRTDAGEVTAERVLLATGKHDVRGLARPRTSEDPALGLRVRLGPAPALTRMIEGAIELHLFDRGYAGLVLQEDGSANLCLAVRKSRLSDAGDPQRLLEAIGREMPALGERLAWLSADASIDAIGAVPYGWRTADTEAGLFRLGDQAAVIPSLAGEGMGIALASGILAAEFATSGRNAPAFQQELARRTRLPITVARTILAATERPASAALLIATARAAPRLATLLAQVTRVAH